MILCLNTNDKYNGCTAKDTITDTGSMPNNVDSQTGSAVATTDKYNGNGNNSNTDSCTYFLVYKELTVRSSDSVVINALEEF